MKYYYSLSCTGSMFESVYFSREIEKFAENVAVNGNFLDKQNFLSKCIKKVIQKFSP